MEGFKMGSKFSVSRMRKELAAQTMTTVTTSGDILAGGFSLFSGVWNSSASAPWTFVSGINAVAATSGARRISVTGGLEYTQWLISGTGSPQDLRVIDFNTFNTTGRIRQLVYNNNSSAIGSLTYDNVAIRDDIRNTVFSGWNPDLLLLSFIGTNDDRTYATYVNTGLNSFFSGFKKYYPNCHVLMCGTYPIVSNGSDTARFENIGQRAACLANKYSYFDGHTPFAPFTTWSGRYGASDGIHSTTSGLLAYREMLDSWFNILEG
jgi:hypothetical protein